jgi:hypothetical protein
MLIQTTCSHPQGTASIRGRGGMGAGVVGREVRVQYGAFLQQDGPSDRVLKSGD